MKRTTIKDIANSLGLSVSTVSRALAEDKNIRRETREQIFAAAEKLGYRRNLFAAGLRNGKLDVVGVIVNDLYSPFIAKVIQGISTVMNMNGMSLMIADSANDPFQERRNIQMMESAWTDGIIMGNVTGNDNIDEVNRLREKGIPVVFFPDAPVGAEASRVGIDNYSKSFFLVDHLICTGHRRILFLSAPLHLVEAKETLRAYKDALRKFNIPFDPALVTDPIVSMQESANTVISLLENGLEFDAVFSYNELFALAAMKALTNRDFRIPEDKAVAALGGSYLSQISIPSLTSVDASLMDMGHQVATIMLQHIKDPTLPPEAHFVPAELKIRNSTRKV